MAEPFLAEIRLFSFNFAPKGWTQCNGQLLPINQNQALFSLLGTNFGGDGRNNFALPNMQNNIAVGFGQASPLSSYALGQTGGSQNVTLNGNQIPPHTHTPKASGARGETAISNPAGASFFESAAGNVYIIPPAPPPPPTFTQMAQNITNSFGSGGQHNNMMPYQGLNWVIALQGIFPPRQ